MTGRLLIAALLAALASAPAHAVEPDEMLADAELEARARALSAELRCMVCPNQSIDESDAPLARDLRILLRERLQAGDSDDMAVAYIVARYGDHVLLRPPLGTATLLLWAAPVIALAGGAAFIWHRTRRRGPAMARAAAAFTTEEQDRLRALLDGRDE